MKNKIRLTIWSLLLLQPATSFAWSWTDLWYTPDQQATRLLHDGQAKPAAQKFKNRDWQAVAHYRAGNYAQSYQQFKSQKTSDGQYNAGNAAAHQRLYKEAIAAYDKALALNPNNTDAVTNREIVKKLLQQQEQQSQSNSLKNLSFTYPGGTVSLKESKKVI